MDIVDRSAREKLFIVVAFGYIQYILLDGVADVYFKGGSSFYFLVVFFGVESGKYCTQMTQMRQIFTD